MAGTEFNVNDFMAHVKRGHEHTATKDLQPTTRMERQRRNCLAHFMSLLKAVHSSGRIVSELIAIDLPEAMLDDKNYEADIIAWGFLLWSTSP